MTENEMTIGGVRYVAVPSVNDCVGCSFDWGDESCLKIKTCAASDRQDGRDVIWKEANDELTTIRELNLELVEAGEACVSAWNSVCDTNGWDRDHLPQFPELSAIIAKARGEK